MPPPFGHVDLLKRARAKIEDGQLPCEGDTTLAGFGHTEQCSLCDTRIDAQEVAYEIERNGRCGPARLIFHIPCEVAWKTECETRAAQA